MILKLEITGEEGTPYAGGCFAIKMVFYPDFPITAPKVNFMTKIYHPNIESTGGKVHINELITVWTATCTIQEIINTIFNVMREP